MVTAAIDIPEQEIAELCRRHGIAELALFGSVLREDFDPKSSDIDLLVEFFPHRHVGFFELAKVEEELSALFGGRRVDLVFRKSINRWIRRRVLDEAQKLYAA